MNSIFLAASGSDLEAEVSKLSKVWDAFWPKGLSFLVSLVTALIVFFVCKKIIRWVLKLVNAGFTKAGVDSGVAGFVGSVLKVILYFVLIMMVANIIGIETTSVMALVGSVGLTVGLALQGSLSNFAGGVLLLLLKPFRVSDYIVAQGVEGTVMNIDLFYTKILTVDNRAIVLPNGTLSNGSIINVTREPERRLDLIVPIGYEDDIRQVKSLLEGVADKHRDMILQDRDIMVLVNGFGDDAVEIAFRVWVKKEDYWTLRAELLEDIKYTFDENNITIPFHQMDIFMKQN